jgi:hypothetical protein
MMSSPIALIAALVLATPAMAFDTSELGQGGTLPLAELVPLINKAPALKHEVAQALVQIKKKPDDVICSGYRFSGQWVHLGGIRVSPYTCDFRGKWLEIKAIVRVSGRSRQVYDAITPAAMQNATRVSETNPTWNWTTEDPSEKK